jgi:hypothetical protein
LNDPPPGNKLCGDYGFDAMTLHLRRTVAYPRVLPVCGIAAMCLTPLTALAQDALPETLQEIVVTAQKRQESRELKK